MTQSAPDAHPPTRVDCFINPNARAAQDQADAFVTALKSAGIEVTIHWMKSCETALRDIADLPATDAVLIGGGDGTISGLLPALLDRNEPIGILPLGTANDFARGLGIPPEPEAAAIIIATGNHVAVDTGRVGDKPFLNVASLGISVEIADLHEDATKKLLGRFAYPIRWVKAWRKHRPLKLDIDLDGETRRIRCSLLALGSGRYFGGGMTLDEKAQLNDGQLHLYYVAPRHAADWLRFLPGMWRGTLREAEGAETSTAKTVRIAARGKNPKSVNADGEIVAKTPVEISVRPQSLTVFAPADAKE